jgi:hypothetical protein
VIKKPVLIDPKISGHFGDELMKRYNESLKTPINDSKELGAENSLRNGSSTTGNSNTDKNMTFRPVYDIEENLGERNFSQKNVSFYLRTVDAESRAYIEFSKLMRVIEPEAITNETILVEIIPCYETI